jgi:hypothetical protein
MGCMSAASCVDSSISYYLEKSTKKEQINAKQKINEKERRLR